LKAIDFGKKVATAVLLSEQCHTPDNFILLY
jgi:hypothetical protein